MRVAKWGNSLAVRLPAAVTEALALKEGDQHWKEILEATTVIRSLCEPPFPLTIEMHDEALRISQRYKYGIYDSLVIAAALEGGCSVLYSEDMQHGQSIGSLKIRNPFRQA